ncbi:Probable FBD-associated F-box protein At1g32375 [Linum grandiflorum]
MKRRRTAAAGELKDRISNLPEDIIHEILACLRSATEPAKLAILSKRWNHLWCSYPGFDFNYYEQTISMKKENLEKFLTATTNKFSALQHVSAVRIQLYETERESDLLEKLLGFVAKVTQEVFFTFYSLFTILPRGLFDDDRFRNLKVVKLGNCKFSSGSSVRFGASLQVLHLNSVKFPAQNDEGDRILNGVIERASCLQNLTLKNIYGVRRFRIRDCLNLKTLKFGQVYGAKFEISGAQSLEILHVRYLCEKEEESHGMLTPTNNNVKVVHITCSSTMTNEALNKFISNFPRIESLELISLPPIPKVKINVINHKFLRMISVDMEHYVRDSWPEVIEIEAPWLSKFVLNIYNGNHRFPDILINKAASEPVLQVSIRYRQFYQIHWHELQRLLARLSQFHLTVEFFVNQEQQRRGIICFASNGDDGSPIQHVKFPLDLIRFWYGIDFMNNLFRNYRPKLLSFTEVVAEQNVVQL